MTSLLAVDFTNFEDLQRIMTDPNFDFNILKLDLSNSSHTDTPPTKALQLLPKLQVFLMAKNKISRFNVHPFMKGAPLLQEIDLSYNNITVLDDIIELGSLQHLHTLDIRENPIVKKFLRIKLIEALLFPLKYKPYDAVKVLTATYNNVRDRKLSPKEEEENKKFHRLLERGEEELDPTTGVISRLCKYDHKATLIKLAQQVCPVPRKTRFPMLTMLNGEIVSIQEMQSIIMSEDLSGILENKEEKERNVRIIRSNEELHKSYVMKYAKKQERKREKELADKKVKIEGGTGQTDLEILQDLREGSGVREDLQGGLWKKPADIRYKDAEFSIGITEFKKMMREYKENKKKEVEEEKKRKEEQRRKQRGKKKRFEDKTDEDEEIEEDIETRRMFRKRYQSKAKPKLQLEMKYSVEQDTSDTELEEKHDEDEKEDWDESDFMVDEEDENEAVLELEMEKGDGSPALGKSMSPRDMKKLVKRMRMSALKEKKEGEGNKGRFTTLATMMTRELKEDEGSGDKKSEEFKGFQLVRLNSTLSKGDASVTFNVEKKEPVRIEDGNQGRDSVTPGQMGGKRGRKFMVVNDSEPNLSVSAYGRSPDRSVYRSPSKGNEVNRSAERKKKYEKNEESANVLSMLADNITNAALLFRSPSASPEKRRENTRRLDSVDNEETAELDGEENKRKQEEQQVEERKKYKLDKLVTSFDQPEQGQASSGAKLGVKSSRIGVSTNREVLNTSSSIIQASYKKAIDILLPQDQQTPSQSEMQVSGPYTLNKHAKMFNKDLRLDPRISSLTGRNHVVSFRLPHSKTTDDNSSSRMVQNNEISLTESKEDSVRIQQIVSQRDPSARETPLIKKIQMRRQAQRAAESHRNGLSLSNSVRNFRISAFGVSPNAQLAFQTPKGEAQLIQLRRVDSTKTPDRYRMPDPVPIQQDDNMSTSVQLEKGVSSIVSAQSPNVSSIRKIRFGEDGTVHSIEQSPKLNFSKSPHGRSSIMTNIMLHMSKKVKDVKNMQTPKAGEMVQKVGKKEGERPRTVMPKRTQVEDLIPGPEQGISEDMKFKILNSRGAKYNKLVNTAKMLDETENIIKEANELHDKVSVEALKKPRVDSVEKRPVRYDQITEFLREYHGGKNLGWNDDKAVRELGELVNEYTKIEGEGMNKFDMEMKLRKLKGEIVGLEGAELEVKYMEIQAMTRLLELQENLEAYRDIHRSGKQMNKLLDKDIKKAEHNAILAAHYLKLSKYCSVEYMNKFMDDDLRELGNGPEELVIDSKGAFKFGKAKGKKVVEKEVKEEKVEEKVESAQNTEGNDNNEAEVSSPVKVLKKEGSLLQYVNRVREEKIEHQRDYPYVKEQPVYTDEKHLWLNVSLIKKYEHQPHYRIEELMEKKRRKLISEHQKKGNGTMSSAEKAIKHAEQFKAENKQKKVLKAKVERYIREGTKNLDDLLESENKGIDQRHDQRVMFDEYMKALWEKKL